MNTKNVLISQFHAASKMLRHTLQQHTGELMERLGRVVTLEVAWVGAV